MNVAQLFHKLRVISDVEIVVALLPEMIRIANQTPRYSLLQRFQRISQRDRWPIQAVFWLEWGISIAGGVSLWFAEEQMNMLRHDYVPVNPKPEAAPDPLQARLEDSPAFVRGEQLTAVVTAECDEMTLTTLVKAY